MLDQICIFTKAGIVLWSKNIVKIKGKDPISELIDILLEEKAGDCTFTIRNCTLKWVRVNKNGIEFFVVAVYSSLLTLAYVDDLLEAVKKNFLRKFEDQMKDISCISIQYDEDFDIILRAAESKNSMKNKAKISRATSTKVIATETEDVNEEEVEVADEEEVEDGERDVSDNPAAIRARLLQKHANKSSRKLAGKGADLAPAVPEPLAPPKKDRSWAAGNTTGKMSKKQKEALDRSRPGEVSESETEAAARAERELQQTRSVYLPEEGEKPLWEQENEEAEEFERALRDMSMGEDDDADASQGSWKKSYFGNMIQSITGNKVLTDEDLQPVLQEMNQMLQGKNVAQEIADDICASVGTSLVGHKLASFTRVSTVVMDALRDAVQRILTPSASVDVLRQVLDARAAGKVFSAVFVGINGVGKSTSLAKVAYYLKQHGVNVLIAACDTFRSGAVEQLRTHSRCLDAPLFEMGYSKDPANVAACALAHARANGFDCVLIDTAGRMQNNEPLMKSLAKLVSDNKPDLVLFVGEALVGNDGIDQLSMFDRALVNYSPPGSIHRIDGIVLTKFDTIDDKVGAALSMSYKSGQPVTFVGTGQKYIHLKKLNVNTVLKHLFT